jgi:hypothetical protein
VHLKTIGLVLQSKGMPPKGRCTRQRLQAETGKTVRASCRVAQQGSSPC